MKFFKKKITTKTIIEENLMDKPETYEAIREASMKLDWFKLSENCHSEQFMEEFQDLIIWDHVPIFAHIPEHLTEKYLKEHIHARIPYQRFSIPFLRKHFLKLTKWVDGIIEYQYLSEAFLRDFKDYFDWTRVCMFQNMSCKFIEEFQAYVCVGTIFRYNRKICSRLSFEFIQTHIDKLQCLSAPIEETFPQLKEDDIKLLKNIIEIN